MSGYLLRRAVQALATIWVVVTVVFALMKMMPGSLARVVLGRQATVANMAAFNQANGMDQALPVQYWRFLESLAHGQITFAPQHVQAVSTMIAGYAQGVSVQQLAQVPLRNTLILIGAAFVVAVPLGMLAGMWLALRRGPLRAAVRVGVGVMYGIPGFFLGLILIEALTVDTSVLSDNHPAWALGDVTAQWTDLIMPALTLALGIAATIARCAETSTMECLQEDYVRTARAKGAPPTRILTHHVLRNSAVTVLTAMQVRLAMMFSIAIPVEVLFHYPGLGMVTWQAASGDDAYTVLGAVLLISIIVIALSLVVDIAYAVLDPRIRYVTGAGRRRGRTPRIIGDTPARARRHIP